MSQLKCPECGAEGKFVSNQYIEHHDAVFDSDGCWVEEGECYDSYHDTDGATCACLTCGYEAEWSDFEEAAEL